LLIAGQSGCHHEKSWALVTKNVLQNRWNRRKCRSESLPCNLSMCFIVGFIDLNQLATWVEQQKKHVIEAL